MSFLRQFKRMLQIFEYLKFSSCDSFLKAYNLKKLSKKFFFLIAFYQYVCLKYYMLKIKILC